MGKYGPAKTPHLDIFGAVKVLLDFFLYQLHPSLTALNVTRVLIVKIFLTILDIS